MCMFPYIVHQLPRINNHIQSINVHISVGVVVIVVVVVNDAVVVVLAVGAVVVVVATAPADTDDDNVDDDEVNIVGCFRKRIYAIQLITTVRITNVT